CDTVSMLGTFLWVIDVVRRGDSSNESNAFAQSRLQANAFTRRSVLLPEIIRHPVGVLPDSHFKFLNAPPKRSPVGGIENIKTVALDRAAPVKHWHRRTVVITGNADERSEWK